MKSLRTGLALTPLAGLTGTALTLPHTASATTTTTQDTVVAAFDGAAHPLRTVEPGGDTRAPRALGRMFKGDDLG
ncbi:hypothetical protein [Streptomyces sp. NPDC055506]